MYCIPIYIYIYGYTRIIYVGTLAILVLAFFGPTQSSVSSLFDLKHTYNNDINVNAQ